LGKGETFMDRGEIIRETILFTLAERYEDDRDQFVTLPRQTMDSPVAREVVAELRNEKHVEEQTRGVIRLTWRGYELYKSHILSCA
jgi:hypothetical protein